MDTCFIFMLIKAKDNKSGCREQHLQKSKHPNTQYYYKSNFALYKTVQVQEKDNNVCGQRKVIVSVNVTLDGFMAGPDGELDWHFQYWTTEMAECLCEELEKADTILMGRITYSAMAGYWPAKAADMLYPVEDRAFATLMNNCTKIVFSRTLNNLSWSNAVVTTGNPTTEVLLLKQQEGKHIMVYGSRTLMLSLIEEGMVDEYHLWVHPVAIGRGKPLFHNALQDMELVKAKIFRSGVVLNYYRKL